MKNNMEDFSISSGHIYICQKNEYNTIMSNMYGHSLLPGIDAIYLASSTHNNYELGLDPIEQTFSPVSIRPLLEVKLKVALLRMSALLSLTYVPILDDFAYFLKLYSESLNDSYNPEVNTYDDVIVLLQLVNVQERINSLKDDHNKNLVYKIESSLATLNGGFIDGSRYNFILHVLAMKYFLNWSEFGAASISTKVNTKIENYNATFLVIDGRTDEFIDTAIQYYVKDNMKAGCDTARSFLSEKTSRLCPSLLLSLVNKIEIFHPNDIVIFDDVI
jgi:hypothetical protein